MPIQRKDIFQEILIECITSLFVKACRHCTLFSSKTKSELVCFFNPRNLSSLEEVAERRAERARES